MFVRPLVSQALARDALATGSPQGRSDAARPPTPTPTHTHF